MSIGASNMRFKAEVRWNGQAIAKHQILQLGDLEQLRNQLTDKEKLEALLLRFGEDVVGMLGKEVDRLEKQIKTKLPEVRHVDLESD